MRSLFIVALPRSLSTEVYHLARTALDLRQANWTSDGEILNADRLVLPPPDYAHRILKYLTEETDARAFAAAIDYLGSVTRPEGYIYKDVVNPFVVARWPALADYGVLKIRRRIADVGFSLLYRGWSYPQAAAPDPRDGIPSSHWEPAALRPWLTSRRWVRRRLSGFPLDQVLTGLARAEETLSRLPGETVDFEDLVRDESVLRAALGRLYPDADISDPCYLDPAFQRRRDQVMARRQSPVYREIQRRLDRMQSRGADPVS